MGLRHHRVSNSNRFDYYTPSPQLVWLQDFSDELEVILGRSIWPLFDNPKECPVNEAQLKLPFPNIALTKHRPQETYCSSKNYYPNLEVIKECLVFTLHKIENNVTVKKTLDEALLKIEAYFQPKEAAYRKQYKERWLQQKKLRQQRIQCNDFCYNCMNEVFCKQEEDCIKEQIGESPFYTTTSVLDEADALVCELYRYLHFILKAENDNATVIYWDLF